MSRKTDDRSLPKDEKTNERLSGKSLSSSGRIQNNGQRNDCHCQEIVEKARLLFAKSEILQAFTELGLVLGSSHGTKKHRKTEQDCIEMIVTLLQSPHSDLLYNQILKIPDQRLRQLLEKLASKQMWREIAAFGRNQTDTESLPKAFAKNMSILDLVSSKELCEAEEERLGILTLLLDNGARLPEANNKILRHALQNTEYRVVQKLIKTGSDPQGLSMSKEHTPYHTAFDIALNKDKGNFSLCQQLLEMHEQDPKRYRYLNPTKDKTVFPLVKKAQSSKELQEAKKLLKDYNFPREMVDIKKNVTFYCEKKHLIKCKKLLEEILKKESNLIEATNLSSNHSSSESKIQLDNDITHRQRNNGDLVVSVCEESKSNPVCGQPKSNRVCKKLKSSPGYGHSKSRTDCGQPKTTPVCGHSKSSTDCGQPKTAPVCGQSKSRTDCGQPKTAPVCGQSKSRTDCGQPKTTPVCGQSKSRTDCEHPKSIPVCGQSKSSTDCGQPKTTPVCGQSKSRTDCEHPKPIPVCGQSKSNTDCRHPKPIPVCGPIKSRTDCGQLLLRPISTEPESLAEKNEKAFDQPEWEVECTRKIWEMLIKKEKPADCKEDIHRIIKQLARGERSKALSKRLRDKNKKPVFLFEAKLRKGSRIIWTPAISLSSRMDSIYVEKIRIWDIVMDHDEIYKSVERFVKCYQYGKKSLVTTKLELKSIPQRTGRKRQLSPMQFQLRSDEGTGVKCHKVLYPLANTKGQRHFKYYDFWNILNSRALDNVALTDIDFPFLTNEVERQVINLPSDKPILVVGRSGTGKTICCLYRLWSRFFGYWSKTKDHSLIHKEPKYGDLECCSEMSERRMDTSLADETNDVTDEEVGQLLECEDVNGSSQEEMKPSTCHLHQLFVTKSQMLCNEVQKIFHGMCATVDLNSEQSQSGKSPFPCHLQDIQDSQYPLFLTSWQLLYILDLSLGEPYFFKDCELSASLQCFASDRNKCTKDLKKDKKKKKTKKPIIKPKKRREMTYELFARDVWPKLHESIMVSVYSPALVWTEIMSFIKGSNSSLKERSGHLDRSGYLKVGKKMAPNFCGNRGKVYEMFEEYKKFKDKEFYFDLGDAVFFIYQKLSKNRESVPWTIHQIYVDEIQDFTQAEIRLLIALAQNPNDMFFCGDTAQGILRGVSFRFRDVKTLFFEENNSRKELHQTLIKVPRYLHQLTRSYRSHAGILRLASSVLELLTHLFPRSFDHLKNDDGFFEGRKPVLIECEQLEFQQLCSVLHRRKGGETEIKIGAHQVVLVVNDEAKSDVLKERHGGLVLTISEAKGLEFDDVLLYNFFSDFQASSEWRVITNLSNQLRELESTNDTRSNGLVQLHEDCLHSKKLRLKISDSDQNKYAALEFGLKSLYTAITRARDRLIIYDENKRKSRPMYDFFKERGLVTSLAPNAHEHMFEDEDSENDCEEVDDKSQWEKRGDEMMKRELFDSAIQCYKNAGKKHKETVAKAFLADFTPPSNEHKGIFLNTARLFLKSYLQFTEDTQNLTTHSHLGQKSAHYLDRAKEYDMAAVMYEKLGLLENAMRLYRYAKNWKKLSHIYETKGDYYNSIKILDENKMYDDALEAHKKYIKWKKDMKATSYKITQEYVEGLYTRAVEFYHLYQQKEKVVAALESLPVEKQIVTLKSYQYIPEAADLMKRNGEVTEAVKVLLNHGYVENALSFSEELDVTNPLKAECIYNKAMQIVRETDKTEEKEHICTKLEECLQKCSSLDLNLRGECCLVLHELQPSGEDHLKTAYQIFSKMEPEMNIAGVLECCDAMNRRHGINDPASCNRLITGVQNTFKVVWAILHSDTDHKTQKASEKTQNAADRKINKTNKTRKTSDNTQVTNNTTQNTADKDQKAISKTRNSTDTTQIFSTTTNSIMDSIQISTTEIQTATIVYFYGLDNIHDKQIKPRFIGMMESDKQYEATEARNTRTGHRKAVEHFVRFLLSRAKEWTDEVEFNLSKELSTVVQCSSFQEGTLCEDADFCPFLHEPYSRALTRESLQLFLQQIQLHSILKTGAEVLQLQDLAWARKDKNYISVQLLLEFLLPSGLLTYNMDESMKFCRDVQRSTGLPYQFIRKQVQLFVSSLCYGLDKSSSEPTVLEKCCLTTHWVVLGSFVSTLFNLDIKLDDICKTLEDKLSKERPAWATNAQKYAVLANPDQSVTLIARKHLEAVQYLRFETEQFNPAGALIRFVEFAELLLVKDNLSMMPEWPILQLWLEVFSTVSLLMSAVCSGQSSIYLPACYIQNLRLVNSDAMQSSKITLLDLLQYCEPIHPMKFKMLLHNLLQRLVSVVCGPTCDSPSLLRFLFRLDQSDHSTRLIIERVVVLMVVMLVNTEHGCVPVTCKDFILRALNTIDFIMMPPTPKRLVSLIKVSKEKENYSSLRDALAVTLRDLHDEMMEYRCSQDETMTYSDDNDAVLFDDHQDTLVIHVHEDVTPKCNTQNSVNSIQKQFVINEQAAHQKTANSQKLQWDNPRRLKEFNDHEIKVFAVNVGFPYHKIGDPKWSKKQEQIKKKRKWRKQAYVVEGPVHPITHTYNFQNL